MQEITLAIFKHMEDHDLRFSREPGRNGIIYLNDTFKLGKNRTGGVVGPIDYITISMTLDEFYHYMILLDGEPFEKISRLLIDDTELITLLNIMKVFVQSEAHQWYMWNLPELMEVRNQGRFDEFYGSFADLLRDLHPEVIRGFRGNYITFHHAVPYRLDINKSNLQGCLTTFMRIGEWLGFTYGSIKTNGDDTTVNLCIPSRLIHPDYHHVFTETDNPERPDRLYGW